MTMQQGSKVELRFQIKQLEKQVENHILDQRALSQEFKDEHFNLTEKIGVLTMQTHSQAQELHNALVQARKSLEIIKTLTTMLLEK